ncbi:hypothetical protein [Bremerella cremea]|uniref:hypothetical protein n=1 Tax=Bremerella cremea TaxID=1031537 RepID=UPI0031E5A3EF
MNNLRQSIITLLLFASLLLLSDWLPAGSPTIAFAQDIPASAEDFSDAELEGEPKLYTSPQSILSDFFGRRRAGMVVNGLEDIVGVTATGLSPLLVLSIASPVVYFMTDPAQRDSLIFLYQPWFFIPVILITLLMMFKDTVLTFASYLKLPLDILGVLFHLLGFLVGFRLIYHLLDVNLGGQSGPMGTILAFGLVALMFAFYTSVWVMSNVFEVLILINPFPLVDTVLRIGRIGVLLCMYLACWIHPALGGLIAVPILILSLITFERSFRTTILGFRLIGDVFLFRSDKIDENRKKFTTFISLGGPLPWLTLGSISHGDNGWQFSYRFLLIGPSRTIVLPPGPYAIAQGSLFPGLLRVTENGTQLILRFPASYRGQEAALAQRFGCEDIHDFRWGTLTRSMGGSIWRGIFGKGKQPTEATPTAETPAEPAKETSLAEAVSPVESQG